MYYIILYYVNLFLSLFIVYFIHMTLIFLNSSRRRAVYICVGGVWVKNSSYIPPSSVSVRRRLVGPLPSQPVICIMFLGYLPLRHLIQN